MMEEFDLKIIKDEDEAAAILARGNTRDLPTSIGSGNTELPGTSQGVNKHTGNSPSNEATRLPGTSPIDLEKDQGTPQSLQTESGILSGENLRSRERHLNLPSKM